MALASQEQEDMVECEVCGKEVPRDEAVGDGNDFCCEECKEHYEDSEKEDSKDEVCEFC